MHIQCIAMRPIYYVSLIKLALQFYSWNFDNYFKLQNIYKRIPSPKRVPIFSSELVSSLIDSGAGLVLSSYMVRFSPGIEQQKQVYSCEANSLDVVWCSYILIMYGQIAYAFTDVC